MDAELNQHLDALHAKLDYIVERQRYTEDFIRDMTPVAREGMTALAGQMAEWESRGWFDLGNEMLSLFDRVANAYGPEDVRSLSDSAVQILDTLRNVTQPDVLAFANDATDVLHHADEVKPVGPLGMMGAVNDKEVQRGLAVGLEILRHLGRARSAASSGSERKPAPTRQSSSVRQSSSTRKPAPAQCEPRAAVEAPDLSDVVMWEGHRFTATGFLVDAADWTPELGEKMAAGLGIELTEEHWGVVMWARQDCLTCNASPNVRRVATGSGVGTKRMYALFPNTPGKSVAMIAGIPKPVGCV